LRDEQAHIECAELLSVAALRIQEDRILTGQRLELVVRPEAGQASKAF
jgi:hypothetical protein